MKQHFPASVWREGDWFVAQCLEVDVTSQGETEEVALANLQEALTLYFTPLSMGEVSGQSVGK